MKTCGNCSRYDEDTGYCELFSFQQEEELSPSKPACEMYDSVLGEDDKPTEEDDDYFYPDFSK